MDASGSLSRDERTTIENSVAEFVLNLEANDAAEVIKFKDTIAVMQAFTTDKRALANAALAPFPNPAQTGSVLYEAITQGIWDAEVQSGIKAVIAITDGDATDNPPFTLTEVLNEAERTGIPVYTIGLGRLLNPALLDEIAMETGGIYYDLPISASIFQAYSSLQVVLRNEWILSFIQPLPLGGTHDIGVDVTYAGTSGSDLKTMIPLCP
jgi:Mg-chelatase subunit ChlD